MDPSIENSNNKNIEFLNFSFKKEILPFNKQKYFKCPFKESRAINNVSFLYLYST